MTLYFKLMLIARINFSNLNKQRACKCNLRSFEVDCHISKQEFQLGLSLLQNASENHLYVFLIENSNTVFTFYVFFQIFH